MGLCVPNDLFNPKFQKTFPRKKHFFGTLQGSKRLKPYTVMKSCKSVFHFFVLFATVKFAPPTFSQVENIPNLPNSSQYLVNSCMIAKTTNGVYAPHRYGTGACLCFLCTTCKVTISLMYESTIIIYTNNTNLETKQQP